MKEICIDNGGTLTDICVFEGQNTFYTKTLTTPYDLSDCFMTGLRKVSKVVYGQEDVERLLSETASIRYSTTQGTNALVQRKGPRIGLVVSSDFDITQLTDGRAQHELFEAMVGERLVRVNLDSEGRVTAESVSKAATELMSLGADRLSVCLAGPGYIQTERSFAELYQVQFPQHLLGTIPYTLSHEVAGDTAAARRIWTTLFNTFLHNPMERFLVSAQRRLADSKSASPLLIFRNDGGTARVSKTAAIKTYSSGPRGGLEAMAAASQQRGFARAVSIDVGGTTSDFGVVENGAIRTEPRGAIEGVPVSLAMSDIVSVGIGGGSIIRVEDGKIRVGPQSVGSAPGPACFGLGGQQATITDVALALGIIDPASFFGGQMSLDGARSRAAIDAHVGGQLGVGPVEAALQMKDAWTGHLAASLNEHVAFDGDAILFAFGGAGPLLMSAVATAAGYRSVLIPRMAAVFSAYGIGHAGLAQNYELSVDPAAGWLDVAVERLMARAGRDMMAEGIELADCEVSAHLADADGSVIAAIDVANPAAWPAPGQVAGEASLFLTVTAPVEASGRNVTVSAEAGTVSNPLVSSGERAVQLNGGEQAIPVYRLCDQAVGASGSGPAIIEDEFFTGLVEAGWKMSVLDGRDVLLQAE
ncbi:hydantoinase/oxoprolinase family protein [Sphingomonas sp. 66-10]|uniref:hydantoinase/oxoprolinase family protein n=1 Tax=Sphingomonas sp. 66-10 TaxID=1895848 RepID=UPI000A912780|nr:hydantoinase/oxoprolinase family protein [Sphingomonas sp. 66-10]